MSVWFCIPAKRSEADSTLHLWRERGYRIALFTDGPSDLQCDFSLIATRGYPGYAIATNALIRSVFASDAEAQFCVIGGDDVEPDLNYTPEKIAEQIMARFRGTFAVCQPVGDRWGEGDAGFPATSAYIDRVCGSAWLGREFCQRIYRGRGPLWPEFTHMFVDEHLQAIVEKLGILWQRRDLIHYHRHALRARAGERFGSLDRLPAHLEQWNTPEHWAASKAIFERLRDAGFIESEDLVPCS